MSANTQGKKKRKGGFPVWNGLNQPGHLMMIPGVEVTSTTDGKGNMVVTLKTAPSRNFAQLPSNPHGLSFRDAPAPVGGLRGGE
jgi:hypothetical protein